MSDKNEAPATGSQPPFGDTPEARAEVERLEEAFVAAGKALVAYVGAAGVCIPWVTDGKAVVAAYGSPVRVLNMTTEAMEAFVQKHENKHNVMSLLAALIGRGPEGLPEGVTLVSVGPEDADDDEVCDCESCQSQRRHPN